MTYAHYIRITKLAIFFISIAFIFAPTRSDALAVNDACSKVEIIFARGSGDGEPRDGETDQYIKQIKQRLKEAPVSVHDYALGTESYGGYQYAHVDAGFWDGHALGASASFGYGTIAVYGKSALDGTYELQSYMTQRYNKCKSSGTYYILGGYSQGAQVIGQVLPRHLDSFIDTKGQLSYNSE